jgi:hypothetical protein
MKKCYSIDGEDFSLTDFSEVIDQLSNCHPVIIGCEYYEADAVPYSAKEFVHSNLDYMLETMDENCATNIGEHWEYELSAVKSSNPVAYKELKDFLSVWIQENTRLEKFWEVKIYVERKIVEEDLGSNL